MSLGARNTRNDSRKPAKPAAAPAPDDEVVDQDADFENGVIGVEAADDPGWFPLHHWANYHPRLNPIQKDLYGKLGGMVNTVRRRNDGVTDVWPTLELLACMVGLSRGDKVLPHLDVLEEELLVAKRRTWFRGLTQRNIYAVRFNPPPDYDGPTTMTEIMEHYGPLADKMRNDDKERKAAQRAARRVKANGGADVESA